MIMYEVKLSSGKIIGPFNSADLKEALQDGRLSGDDLVRRTDGGDFVPIRSVRGLKDLIQPLGNARTSSSTTPKKMSNGESSVPPTSAQSTARFESSSDSGVSSNLNEDEDRSLDTYPTPPSLDAGDKVLRAAFSVGRWFSIIVISVCAFSLVGAIIFYIMNSGFDAQPAPVNQTIRPTSTLEFIEICRIPTQTTNSSSSGQSSSGSSRASGVIDPCQKYRSRIIEITQALGITSPTNASGKNSGDVICDWIQQIPGKDKEQFVDDFVAFAKSFQATAPKPANCDGAKAATFFHDEFLAALMVREQQEKAAAIAADLENARRQAMQQWAVYVAVGAVANLLVFLFFPLLIQIERNTRPIGL
jgi:hypothetical protein